MKSQIMTILQSVPVYIYTPVVAQQLNGKKTKNKCDGNNRILYEMDMSLSRSSFSCSALMRDSTNFLFCLE